MAARARPYRPVERVHRVGGDAEVDRDPAAGFDDPGDGEIVRGDDLRRAERPAGRDELVAGRQHGDPRPSADGQIDMIGRRRQRHVSRRQASPRRNEELALAEVQSRRTQVVARGHCCFEVDAVAFAPHVFLNYDRVRALRHRRAGENPRRLARPDDSAEGAPGGGFADHGQRRGKVGRVRRAQGIAVHRRIGEGRLGAQGDEIARQHAVMGGGEPDALLAERGFGRSEDAVERLLN